NRKGFSLILSLTMMAMIVFVVIVLAAFLNVESRAAATFHLATRARLNALMSGRLALAHLQQTAGPDRRATATGDLALDFSVFSPPSPYVATLSSSEKMSQGQRIWTGVWRTDKPDQPPAWLISGKGGQDVTKTTTCYTAQSVSTWGKDINGNDITDYNNTYWLPWTTDYPVNPTAPSSFAVLVGNGSAVLEPGTDGKYGTSDDVDGRIALPKIPIPGITQGTTIGNYAYWIGDEGVKARINLQDSRDLTGSAPTSNNVINALRSPGRLGTELITGLTGVAVNQAELNQITSTQQLALVPGYTTTTNGLDSRKLSFHNQTLWSSGVLADSFHGGLKRDLSLAFEMDDYDFDYSDFGSGAKGGSAAEVAGKTKGGSVTEFYDTTLRNSAFPEFGGNTNTKPTVSATSPTDPKPRVWVPMYEAGNNNSGRVLPSGEYLPWSPVFIREDSVAKKRFVGPLWHVLRDYYRLYKEIDWSSDVATLPARSFFPNNSQFISGNYKILSAAGNGSGNKELYDPYDYESAYAYGPYGIAASGSTSTKGSLGYGKLYPGANHAGDALGTPNPVIGKDKAAAAIGFIPRVTRSAYMPNLHRVILAFSLKKRTGFTVAQNTSPAYTADKCAKIYVICTPVVVLHNPYNVKLKLQSSASETDPNIKGTAMRVSVSGLDQVCFQFRDTYYKSGKYTIDQWYTLQTNRFMRSIFNTRKYKSNGDDNSYGEYESFVVTIPPTTLEPGEFAVFSSKKLLDNNSLDHGDNYYTTNKQLFRASDDSAVWILPLEKGFYYTGGFYGELPWYSSDLNVVGYLPGYYGENMELYCGLKFGSSDDTNGYWKCWTNVISGWKGNKLGAIDEVNNDSTLDPGYLEQLGSNKYTCKAGLGQTVYIGNYGKDPTTSTPTPTQISTHGDFYGSSNGSSWRTTGGGGVLVQTVKNLNEILDGSGNPNTSIGGHIFGVIDTRMRVADTKRDTPNISQRDSAIKSQNIPAPHPAWLFTNPLAPFSSNAPLGGLPAIGNASLRTQIYGADTLGLTGVSNNWGNLLVNDYGFADGARALGGSSHEAAGISEVVEVEIPQTAPVSIGQLMHANVSSSDLFPYRTIGNSF
ncbi:MAG: hypothetical protein WCP40_05965, partial [Opitutae bacterium]